MPLGPARLRAVRRLVTTLVAAASFGAAVASPALAQFAPESGFADLVDRLSPAVVNIRTSQTVADDMPAFPPGSPLERFNDYFSGPQRTESALGSGFVIDPAGIIVTNDHVIQEADDIEVAFPDGLVLNAEIVGRDPATDLAVLRVDGGSLPSVSFGNSDTARVGDWVVAIGNPFGLGNSVSVGVVSARNRDIQSGRYDDFIQTDAAINRGNSGGPLFDLEGNVVGVNSAIYSPTGGSVGIGFSIPANLTVSIVDQLMDFGETRRGWLGVRIQAVDDAIAESYGLPGAAGVLITRVTEGGPAETAGLQGGDLVLSFDGQEVEDERGLTDLVTAAEEGAIVSVEFIREGEHQTVDVVIELLDEGDDSGRTADSSAETVPGAAETVIGLTLAPITDADRNERRIPDDVEGVLVTAVDPASDAYGKIQEGDIIEEVAFQPVTSPDEAAEHAAAEVEAGKPVLLLINRGGDLSFHSIRDSR